MARQKSDDKRSAIVAAAVRVIVQHGLSVPTATIAREAGVANGSLFTYFETKADLYNQLYLDLKTEMATAALEGFPAKAKLRDRFFHVWSRWIRWAAQNPDNRRALAILGVADEITPATRAAGHKTMASLAALMDESRSRGAMRDAPFALVAALMTALAEATMDFVIEDPGRADQHSKVGFEALLRMLG